MPNKLINDCYQKSIELLLKNSTKLGVMASSPSKKSRKKIYTNIFGRDASICALGMVASKNRELIKSAKRSLLTLSKYQTELGQIPSSVNPETGQSAFYFLGSIDSTLWWLIAVDFYNKNSADIELKIKLLPQIKKAITWLRYQDRNNDGLLEEGESCNWSDDMPDNGRTLYTNILWYRVLDIYGFKREKELAADGLNTIFLPHKAKIINSLFFQSDPHHRKKELSVIKDFVNDVPYYLHYISYRHASDRCDVYSNILTILFGLTNKKIEKSIIDFLRKKRVSKNFPVSVLTPPIDPRDFDWRPNMDEDTCANKPYSYHNGGVWPYVGAFYAMSLKKAEKEKLAIRELARTAEANKINRWQFNEWFHLKTGEPMGMPYQSWNAGTFLLAYHYLKNEIII